MKKSNLEKAVETATTLSSAEIVDRVLRKMAGNDVSSVLQGQNITTVSSSLAYAGLAKTGVTIGGAK